ENSDPDVTVGYVGADDDGGPGNLRYAIASNSHFDIDEVTGRIFVKPDAKLDFEDTSAYSVTVTVTDKDGDGLSTTHELTITLNDVDEAPTVPVMTGPGQVLETAGYMAAVGTLTSEDPEGGPVTLFFEWADGT